ncbi:hypothetical protein LXL04_014588 [Taraxacum kok-saghyz]
MLGPSKCRTMSSLTPSLGMRSIFHSELCLCIFVVVVDCLRDRIPTHIRDQKVLIEALVVLVVGFEIDIVWQIKFGNNSGLVENDSERGLKNRSDEKVEETCDQVTQAADAVKKGATQITNMTKDVRGKVTEAADTITQKTKDDVVDVAGKKLKQTVVDEK